MSDSNSATEAIRKLLPNKGRTFLLRDAVVAMETLYATVDPSCPEIDAKSVDLIVVAGKYGSHDDRRIEIGLYRSFDLFNRLEVLLTYRVGWRNLFLPRYLHHCESRADAAQFFAEFRNTAWYYRYSRLSPVTSSITWRGPEGMATLYNEVLPVITESMGGCCEWYRTTSNDGRRPNPGAQRQNGLD